jgi:sulfur carrier protein ThiS
MTVKYFRAGGAGVQEIEVPPGARIADVLAQAQETPERLTGCFVRVGGQRVSLKEALDQPVRPDIEVIVVPKIRGG